MFDQDRNQPRQQNEQNGRWYFLAKAASYAIAEILDFAVMTRVPAAPLGCVFVQATQDLIPLDRIKQCSVKT